MRRRKKGRVRSARFKWSLEWLEAVFTKLGLDISDRQHIKSIASAIKKLSDTFIDQTGTKPVSNRNPPAQSRWLYGNDNLLRTAYAAYYLPVNVPKIVEILESMWFRWDTVQHILDIGSGPGTAAVACLIARVRAGLTSPIDITVCDHSRDFLELSKKIIILFRRILNIPGDDRFFLFDLSSDSDKRDHAYLKTGYDLALAANIIAEIPEIASARLADFFAGLVNPGGHVVFLEPARRQPARHVTAIRDELTHHGWNVLYPCPASYPCPLMSDRKDWCHHRLFWQAPEHISAIDRLIGMEKNLLNFTGFILEKPLETDLKPVESEAFNCDQNQIGVRVCLPCRVISDVRPQKGRYCVHVCGVFDGKARALQALLEKKRMTDYTGLLANLARYDLIRLENVSIRGNQLILDENSRLTTCIKDDDRE